MRRHQRLALRIVARLAAVASLASAACNGSYSTPSAPQELPGQVGGGSTGSGVCPATLATTAGASCDTEGLMCGPQYTCDGIVAAARCLCTDGGFVCMDVTGAALSGPDASPACPARRAPETCPSSVAQAALMPCTEPYLVCTYASDCDATPAFRQCTCTEGPLADGGTGLAFRCPDDCPYVAPPIEIIGADAATD